MNVLDLFTGIGGFTLGLTRAGMRTVAFCEYDEKCRQLLKKRFPGIPIHNDIRTFNGEQLRGKIDLICGGFPCKQTSYAAAIHGKRTGLDGDDSGLWWQYYRVVHTVRPTWVIVENPSGVSTWAGTIQSCLEGLGYRVSRQKLSSMDRGAINLRERVFFIAHSGGKGLEISRDSESFKAIKVKRAASPGGFWREYKRGDWRMDDRVPGRVDRLKQIGNSVDPILVEIIGAAILKAHSEVLA